MKKELLYGFTGLVIGAVVSGILVFNQVSRQNISSPSKTIVNEPDHSMMGHNMNSMSMDDMTKELKDKKANDFDKVFIEMMIPHHQGAIDMAKLALNNADHQEIKDMAKEIIKAQESEIKMMREWQSNWEY